MLRFLNKIWLCKISRMHQYSTPFSEGIRPEYKPGSTKLELITEYCENIKMTCKLCDHEFEMSKYFREKLISSCTE